MTPRQARAARAMLGLDMKTVCAQAAIGKRTLAEFEAGNRAMYAATESKLKAFYISKGLSFSTQENGESVGFPKSTPEFGLIHEVRGKKEYFDLLEVEGALDKISSISSTLKDLIAGSNISQIIISDILKRSGLKQKELAARLECTPSFINAVSAGKKKMPDSYARKLQEFFDNEYFDVQNALDQEKRILKLSSQLLSISQEYEAAWLQILL